MEDNTFLAAYYDSLDMTNRTDLDRELIQAAANKHYPLVQLASDEIGLMTGIDLTFSYLGMSCPLGDEYQRVGDCIRVQMFATSFVHHKLFIEFSILKPNSLLLSAYILTKEFDTQLTASFVRMYKTDDYAVGLLRYFGPFLGDSAIALLDFLDSKGQRSLPKEISENLVELNTSFEQLVTL